jgi:pimeloyl-ACP methyl ester carboxylesterase
MPPETRYADSGGVNIAYQVVGSGTLDLIYVMGWVSNLDSGWEEPSYARFFTRLASFTRLILFDKRGTGLSDRVPETELPTLEQRMDDVRAVMDAAGSQRAALMGISEGGPMCVVFAATYPHRTSALVIIGGYARRLWAPDYTFAPKAEAREDFMREIREGWGGPVGLAGRAPSMAHDERFKDWWARYLRTSASPGAVSALTRMNAAIDVRRVLPSIHVPTLVIHRTGDRTLDVEHGRYMAREIPNARYVELPGDDHLPWVGDQDAILDEVEEFLTGVRRGPESDRVLATVLFTDIVGSTEHAARIGDRRWRDVLDSYYAQVRRELVRFRGREIDTAGDGVLATFDGPARAIRCACEIGRAVRSLGIEVRSGLHTGEIEIMGTNVGGIAVHIGARVAAQAEPGEVLVSSTVKDLVAGSGIEFDDRGMHVLKGVPEQWRLFAVASW